MPAWDSATPFRTGIPTILRLLAIVCRLLTAFNVVIKTHLRDDLHVYVDALMTACEEFRANIPSPNDG